MINDNNDGTRAKNGFGFEPGPFFGHDSKPPETSALLGFCAKK